MSNDATWVDPLSEPPVDHRSAMLNPFCATPVNNARQHPHPGFFRGPVVHTLWLDCGAGRSSLGLAVFAEMVLQWRRQRFGAKYAFQGGHGHGELSSPPTDAQRAATNFRRREAHPV
jgi:hypothetical protein